VQHAHPAAPEELKRSFTDFLKKFQSTVRTNGRGSSSGAHVYQEFWEAPSKYWNSRLKTISEEEVDAVLVSVHHHSHRLHAHRSFPERRSDAALDYTYSLRTQQYDTPSLQSFSAYASKCLSTSASFITRHRPLRSAASSSLSETIPISTSPGLKSVACTVEIASIAIWSFQT